jgi:hypothetical protein
MPSRRLVAHPRASVILSNVRIESIQVGLIEVVDTDDDYDED